jgi:hypothetical protein
MFIKFYIRHIKFMFLTPLTLSMLVLWVITSRAIGAITYKKTPTWFIDICRHIPSFISLEEFMFSFSCCRWFGSGDSEHPSRIHGEFPVLPAAVITSRRERQCYTIYGHTGAPCTATGKKRQACCAVYSQHHTTACILHAHETRSHQDRHFVVPEGRPRSCGYGSA